MARRIFSLHLIIFCVALLCFSFCFIALLCIALRLTPHHSTSLNYIVFHPVLPHSTTLRWVALSSTTIQYCFALLCVEFHGTALQSTLLHSSLLHCNAQQCAALDFIALHFVLLQLHCSQLYSIACIALTCNELQSTPPYCNASNSVLWQRYSIALDLSLPRCTEDSSRIEWGPV